MIKSNLNKYGEKYWFIEKRVSLWDDDDNIDHEFPELNDHILLYKSSFFLYDNDK